MLRAMARTRVWCVSALLASGAALLLGLQLSGQALALPLTPGGSPQAVPTDKPNPRTLAKSKLLQARAQLSQGKFDTAESLAKEAAKLGLTYRADEDSPAKVLKDIASARTDAATLLKARRSALDRKQFDQAEKYARTADKLSGILTFPVWGDTPAKALKDISTARKAAGPAVVKKAPDKVVPAKPAPASPATRTDPIVVAQAKSKLLQARAQLNQGNLDSAESLANEVAKLGLTYRADEDSPAKVHKDLAAARSDPALLLKASRSALARKEFDSAEKYALLADKNSGFATFPVWGDTPAKALKDISVARKSVTPQVATTTTPEKKPAPTIVQVGHKESSPEPVDAHARAKSKLLQARAQLNQGNLDSAERLANEVAKLGLTYRSDEDSPAKVHKDLAAARSDATVLLKASRSALARKDFDVAEKYARLADKTSGFATFPVWGDTPAKALKDISVARKSVTHQVATTTTPEKKPAPTIVQAGHKESSLESVEAHARAKSKLQQARAQLAQCNFDSAEHLAHEVAGLLLSYRPEEDSPAKVFKDLAAAQSNPALLLKASRSALARKEFDVAEKYAHLADKQSSFTTFPVWGDTPAKSLKDIADAPQVGWPRVCRKQTEANPPAAK